MFQNVEETRGDEGRDKNKLPHNRRGLFTVVQRVEEL
jgi:hypothetical protein